MIMFRDCLEPQLRSGLILLALVFFSPPVRWMNHEWYQAFTFFGYPLKLVKKNQCSQVQSIIYIYNWSGVKHFFYVP